MGKHRSFSHLGNALEVEYEHMMGSFQPPTVNSRGAIAYLLGVLSVTSCSPGRAVAVGTHPENGSASSSSSTHDFGSEASVSIDVGTCPTQQESAASKLAPLVEGALAPDTVVTAIVHLRPIGTSPRSQDSASDESTPNRAEQNAQQVRCVLDAFGTEGARPLARWYEPITGIGADNLPIGVAFSANARWAALVDVAKHPYVAQITLEFGESVRQLPHPTLRSRPSTDWQRWFSSATTRRTWSASRTSVRECCGLTVE